MVVFKHIKRKGVEVVTFMVLNLQVLRWSPELRVILMILLAATPSCKNPVLGVTEAVQY